MLRDTLVELGEKPYRAQQILSWLYDQRVGSFDEMTNLSKQLREKLSNTLHCDYPTVLAVQTSCDQTRKFLIELADKTAVEMVAMPHEDEHAMTVCVSSQVGCPLDCAFCATGKMGLTRNLAAHEIVDQVIIAEREMDLRAGNIVFMGQGEPFLNFAEVTKALTLLNSGECLNIGARKITVSTSGVAPQIKKWQEIPEQYGLAISLHSAIQETRDALMPRVRQWPLEKLHQALEDYISATNRRPTIEYALMRDINDTPEQIAALAKFARTLHCHINLIMLNEIDGSPFLPTLPKRMSEIAEELKQAHAEVTIRRSRGQDIDAACGQLAKKLR